MAGVKPPFLVPRLYCGIIDAMNEHTDTHKEIRLTALSSCAG